MNFFIIVIIFFYWGSLFAQTNIQKKDSCICTAEIKLSTPDYADEDSVTARVVLEIDIDSNCRMSNPVIITGASIGRNKAALDYARQYINAFNKCKCRFKFTCVKRKEHLPLVFYAEE